VMRLKMNVRGHTDLVQTKKLNNFIVINVSDPYLAGRRACSSMLAE
jgi:hypothetical protein